MGKNSQARDAARFAQQAALLQDGFDALDHS
jgi:hypothetical protein